MVNGVDAWMDFVVANGHGASVNDLAAVLGVDAKQIQRLRASGACTRLPRPLTFAELFSRWHGRAPEALEWPRLVKGASGHYRWDALELGFLASLVGQLSVPRIASVMTARLRLRTEDAGAERTPAAIQSRIAIIGLQAGDVLGGITVADAARETGSSAPIYNAIQNKSLVAQKKGRLLVIPYKEWERWKASRVAPPKGFVRLSTLKQPLGVRSDKLSEFARLNFIPTAVRCKPCGAKGPSTKFGTWYVDPTVARQLVADRRAGNPMPWSGRPIPENLASTYRLWCERRHPKDCKTCVEIWGTRGAPSTRAEYEERYPPLAHGQKRHITMHWSPGLTVSAVAKDANVTVVQVRRAIANGALFAEKKGGALRISRTDATRWKARKCPTGESMKSWISMSNACKTYLFSERELRVHIAAGDLVTKTGVDGAMRGIEYVLRDQCRRLREGVGFTEVEAARRVGVSVERLGTLLSGIAWRKAEGIPLATVQAAIKRKQSQEGFSLAEAADALGVPLDWVKARKRDGTVRVHRAKWDRRRQYLTAPMLDRLRAYLRSPTPAAKPLSGDWLSLGEAAMESGVCTTTIVRWASEGCLKARSGTDRMRYHRESIRARARTYWMTCHFKRAQPPTWLREETANRRGGAPGEERGNVASNIEGGPSIPGHATRHRENHSYATA